MKFVWMDTKLYFMSIMNMLLSILLLELLCKTSGEGINPCWSMSRFPLKIGRFHNTCRPTPGCRVKLGHRSQEYFLKNDLICALTELRFYNKCNFRLPLFYWRCNDKGYINLPDDCMCRFMCMCRSMFLELPSRGV